MAVSKHIDRICYAAVALALVIALLLMIFSGSGDGSGVSKEYETSLFDASVVHTIDIQMDDWEDFIAGCEDEQYTACDVVIDGQTYKNVGIRAKGNTSLSNVSSLGSSRYSFKIEFDCYDEGQNCQGLDKLSLNNIIQDDTYMKDFICYQLMDAFGADAPLCSYSYITVNGDDWGLYLAVEGIEESFLERNYGTDYGELYKPDSSDMGGGRGNGRGFEFDADFDFDQADAADSVPELPDEWQKTGAADEQAENKGVFDENIPQSGMQMPMGDMQQGGQNRMQERSDENTPQMPQNGMQMPTDGQMPELPDGEAPEKPDGDMPTDGGMDKPDGGQSRGSDDVLLRYSDDDPDSYSNIFDNAKTAVTGADKSRLIESLKKLNSGEDIESVVDIDEVLRYFAVHNFVCNFDSYTGSMIHNYYLYEKDGKLSMIPWDYNLAFGGFESGVDATSLVNYPIDDPVSGTAKEDRPMLAWIFENEEYTEMYHEYMRQFIEQVFTSGEFEKLIDGTYELIAPYVEKDPTKFCTYEEFQNGVQTLRQFCLIRAQSVSGQLDGSIPSTEEGQQNDRTALVDASSLRISDMGGMDNTMQGGGFSPSKETVNVGAEPQGNAQKNNGFVQIAVSAAAITAGIVFAAAFKRRR